MPTGSSFLWEENFIWEAPEETPFQTTGPMATTGFEGAFYMVYGVDNGSLRLASLDVDDWSESQDVGIATTGNLALATSNGQMTLAYVDDQNQLATLTYSLAEGWSTKPTVLAKEANNVSLASYNDGTQLMLAYTDASGQLYSITTDTNGKWQSAVTVGFSTTGDIQLGVLGTSIYLIFQDTANNQMMVCSYNTADFNVVTLEKTAYNGPQSNTTKDKWSPNVYPVAHYSATAYPGTPKEKEPVTQPYVGAGPLACATLDGVMHLVHAGVNNPLMLTESFSIHGIMTPELPISYDPTKSGTTNSGYGTLAQAGWSEQVALHGTYVKGGASMAEVDW